MDLPFWEDAELIDLISTALQAYKQESWEWTSAQDKAFNKLKELRPHNCLFISTQKRLLLLACDACAYTNGVFLDHKMPDGSEKPIGYALNSAERNYSQLEEGFSLVFGIKWFYSYLFGRSFTLLTDHKLQLGLLDSQKPTSLQASVRVRRWSLYVYFLAFECSEYCPSIFTRNYIY
jgi:hypothetical protein